MLVFLFKNKFKGKEKHPDYVVRDLDRNIVGNAYDKIDKNGETFQTIYINEE